MSASKTIRPGEKEGNGAQPPSPGRRTTATPLSPSLAANAHALRAQFRHSGDLRLRLADSPAAPGVQIAVLYLQGIVDEELIRTHVLEAIQKAPAGNSSTKRSRGEARRLIQTLRQGVISSGLTETLTTLEKALDALVLGCCLILIDGSTEALAAEASDGAERPTGDPADQTVLRGPKQNFTEPIHRNIGLVRRIVKSERLTVESMRIGRETCTEVALLYIHGIADPVIVEEARSRLRAINIDSVLDSGYIEEFIQEAAFTPFPTLIDTERPDQTAAALLEGQFAVVVDGSPYVLIGPATFFRFFQSPEDYYQRFDMASFLRLLRMLVFFISLHLPALYVAVTAFHQHMLSASLLEVLATRRAGMPLPALAEVLLLELVFEALREAGVRMPRAIGPAMLAAGKLVLGIAAVEAGIVSPAALVIVAFSAIANFIMPQLSMAMAGRVLRLLLMIGAGLFGLIGILSVDLLLIIHLSALKSFGVPYLTPLAPYVPGEWKDTFIRAPRWSLRWRPVFARGGDRRRQPGGRPKRGRI